MAMLQFTDRMPFGKFSGKSLKDVFNDDPGYLWWLMETGFGGLGKEVTLTMLEWADVNHKEAARISRSVEVKKAKVEADVSNDFEKNFPSIANQVPAQRAPQSTDPNWASW